MTILIAILALALGYVLGCIVGRVIGRVEGYGAALVDVEVAQALTPPETRAKASLDPEHLYVQRRVADWQ